MSDLPERPFVVNEAEYPFESHWFERDGSHMHYIDEGKGIPVLLLHGNPTWSFLYRKVIKQITGFCRAIAPDYPGFGMSDYPPGYDYMPQGHAEWVTALIDYLKLEQFILVLQDWGGPIGMSIAVDQPDNIAGLVIANTWAWKEEDWKFRLFSAVLGGPVGRYLILRHNLFARRILPMTLRHAEAKSSEIIDHYLRPFATPESRMGTYVFPREINKSGDWLAAIETKLHTLSEKPIELVMGSKDVGLGNDKVISRWQRHFPQAVVTRVSGAGHFIQEDAPDQVAAAIQRVIERQQS